MRRSLIVCFFAYALLATAHPAAAQRLLPASFGGWNENTWQSVSLEQALGEDAAAIREYGFVAVERADYVRGKGTLSLTLYKMVDPSAAYGAFTFLRAPEMTQSKISIYSASSASRALIVIGNFLVDANGSGVSLASSDLKSLAVALKSKADPRPFPTLANRLPPHGIVSGSEHYFLGPVALQRLFPVATGDWLGFGEGAEAFSARYQSGGQAITLLVAEFPTQQVAAKCFDSVQSAVRSVQGAPNSALTLAAIERKDDLISIAFGQNGSKYASALIDQIESGHNVIWDEPTYKATDLSWGTYVVGAFTGTGIIMLFSIASGIGFGFLRVLVKFLLPGKVFDRHRAIEVIQLGLTGKEINTKDFY